ncbi:MAG: DegT/DnrJ/EryC1/StrS family aminotransferase [Bacteroidetes bacterium]|jgi:perosamine synthetase|nr:DegT/DnrJ/EryC1/StrS family aminotransferase [Bacteroidota bacterium]MBK9413202.1 DegT/DnrJ/EryC1/StrS family aminotransferase [Bacteroidota bacterium]MBP6658798.1 DegT/DnrJ/EryC1/StrS family aminotransferase [Bacteroidia bacterium]
MIPVNTPLLNGNEEKYLLECIRTGWISSEGPFIKEFEEKFSAYVNRKHGIAVANGSAALDVAVQALQLSPGDEVIMPAFTIISPAQSVVKAGLIPVLVDSDPETWNMDVSLIENKITSRTKAIIVVHIYGLPVDMDPVLALCKKHNLLLIEDAAEMHGQTYKGKVCGSFGDISIFSFYPNKHITTGEGGMIVCDSDHLAARCRKLRNLAFEPDGRRFIHFELGWNYRMTNMQAALGLAQLERIGEHIEKKRKVGKLYQDGLSGLKNFQFPKVKTEYSENIFWVYALVADSQSLCESTVEKLSKEKIGTRPFFWCMHEQPVFQNMGLFKNEKYPVAERLARNGFYLPSGLGLSEEDVNTVISTMKKICS